VTRRRKKRQHSDLKLGDGFVENASSKLTSLERRSNLAGDMVFFVCFFGGGGIFPVAQNKKYFRDGTHWKGVIRITETQKK